MLNKRSLYERLPALVQAAAVSVDETTAGTRAARTDDDAAALIQAVEDAELALKRARLHAEIVAAQAGDEKRKYEQALHDSLLPEFAAEKFSLCTMRCLPTRQSLGSGSQRNRYR